MKHLLNTFVLFVFLFVTTALYAESPKREFRATWLTTGMNIDWPGSNQRISPTASSRQQEKSREAQKTSLNYIMNRLVEANMNATMFQVRSMSDAMYKSSYEPWSSYLSGTRGFDPGYDPLAYAVETAHAKGLELHVWINPFRYESTQNAWGADDPLRKNHPDWILYYSNNSFKGTILDPGNPEVRAYIVEVIREIVRNYDIDGVIFDDYFYPYGGTSSQDAASKDKYKPADQNVHDWRRENIDKAMKAVYDMIQQEKPWVRFGLAPFGIYSNESWNYSKYGLTAPSGIKGSDAYNTLYCNTLEWMQGGYVDYVSPQIYWPTTSTQQNYGKLAQFWSNAAVHFTGRLAGNQKVHFFSSQTCSMDADFNYGNVEMGKEIDLNRTYDQLDAPGTIFFNTSDFYGEPNQLHKWLAANKFTQIALPPAMDWKTTTTLAAPTNLKVDGTTLTWTHPNAPRFTVYAFPKTVSQTTALTKSSYLLGVTYTNSFDISDITDVANTTFAVCAYDRYGNEYTAAVLNAGNATTPDNPNDNPNQGTQNPTEGTVSMSSLWTYTSVATDNDNRSMAYYNGKLYLPYKSAGTIHVIDAATGKKSTELTIGDNSFGLHNVRITPDGQMLYGNTNSATQTPNITIKSSSLTAGGSSDVGAGQIAGRSDFFYTFGKWNESGYIVALSNTGNAFTKIPFQSGMLLVEEQVTTSAVPVGTAAKAVPADDKSFYASAMSIIPTKHDLATGALLDQFGSEKPATVKVSGLAVFTIKGNTYMITPADIYGGFEVFDITKGLSKAVKVINATQALGSNNNVTYTIDFCVNVSGNDAYIYVLAPNNGIAAYKFTFTPAFDSVEQIIAPALTLVPTQEGVQMYFEGTQPISVYTVNGTLITNTIATDSYEASLPQGVYIVRVGNTIQKFVR